MIRFDIRFAVRSLKQSVQISEALSVVQGKSRPVLVMATSRNWSLL